ncbi:hypothetical protein BGX28_005946 [Mortierella sp. GBA30]|nr:hypothetical protein BGX28_005946 [Mortierella sp. GBA30]
MRSSFFTAALTMTVAMTALAGPIPVKDIKEAVNKKCNKACVRMYEPVCAQFQSGSNKTFGNSCELSVYQCEHPTEAVVTSSSGTCDASAEEVKEAENNVNTEATIKKCNKACTLDYNPVCAQFQKGHSLTFGNSCALSVYQCEHPTEAVVTSAKGTCEATAEEVKKAEEVKEVKEVKHTDDETGIANKRRCNKACILLHDPICAQFQKGHNLTFGNACELSVYQCENPAEAIVTFAKGTCL